MTVPLRAVRHWMVAEDQPVDADVPVHSEAPSRGKVRTRHTVLRWRGAKDATAVDDPNELRPGDTIVIAAPDESSLILGHFPEHGEGVEYDVAETAFEKARRQRLIRLHPAVHPELVRGFEAYLRDRDTLTKSQIREALGILAQPFSTGPFEVDYPNESGVVFRFGGLLPSDDWKQKTFVDDDGDDSSSGSTQPLLLSKHVADVVECTRRNVCDIGLDSLASLFNAAAKHHDAGKADLRFSAMLAGLSPYDVLERPPLAKSGERWLSAVERRARRTRALLPLDFRHEAVSMQWIDHHFDSLGFDNSIDCELLLHIVAAHHGYARPFLPVCDDRPNDPELLAFDVDGQFVSAEERQSWTPAHRLDSGVAERFWAMTRRFGWWGLAYLESILRLADQEASAKEQREAPETKDATHV